MKIRAFSPPARRCGLRAAGLAALLALGGCASLMDSPRFAYRCPQGLDFQARLYDDIAMLDGLRGHAVLNRQPLAPGDDPRTIRYADDTVRATFALGLDQRLARLDYTAIPEPVYCERAAAAPGESLPPVRATRLAGPRPPPPPPDPNAPIETNIKTGDGENGPG